MGPAPGPPGIAARPRGGDRRAGGAAAQPRGPGLRPEVRICGLFFSARRVVAPARGARREVFLAILPHPRLPGRLGAATARTESHTTSLPHVIPEPPAARRPQTAPSRIELPGRMIARWPGTTNGTAMRSRTRQPKLVLPGVSQALCSYAHQARELRKVLWPVVSVVCAVHIRKGRMGKCCHVLFCRIGCYSNVSSSLND